MKIGKLKEMIVDNFVKRGGDRVGHPLFKGGMGFCLCITVDRSSTGKSLIDARSSDRAAGYPKDLPMVIHKLSTDRG